MSADTVTVSKETIDRVLFQLGAFASLLETHPEMSSTKASHIDALGSTLRDEAHALGICRRYGCEQPRDYHLHTVTAAECTRIGKANGLGECQAPRDHHEFEA